MSAKTILITIFNAGVAISCFCASLMIIAFSFIAFDSVTGVPTGFYVALVGCPTGLFFINLIFWEVIIFKFLRPEKPYFLIMLLNHAIPILGLLISPLPGAGLILSFVS